MPNATEVRARTRHWTGTASRLALLATRYAGASDTAQAPTRFLKTTFTAYLITRLVESYGYVLLFLLVGLESLGIPLPGETALVVAAAFAASGHLSIYIVVAAAAAAAILGDNAGYWIRRKGGLALVRRYGRFVHLNESHIRRAQDFFDTIRLNNEGWLKKSAGSVDKGTSGVLPAPQQRICSHRGRAAVRDTGVGRGRSVIL